MKRKFLSVTLAASLIFGQMGMAFAEEADTFAPITEPDFISGVYTAPLNVTLTSNESATIYYTLDGTYPSEDNYAGFGENSVSVRIDGFYNVLSFRAKDTAGNWEDYTKTEIYKISPVDVPTPFPGTDLSPYYTNYVSVSEDNSKVVYAKREGPPLFEYKELHLISGGVDSPLLEGLPFEIDYTAITGDDVIYGDEKQIHRYNLISGTEELLYEAGGPSATITALKAHSGRIAFLEDGVVKVLDIAASSPPVEYDNDFSGTDDSNQFDLSGDRLVWMEGSNVYLNDWETGDTTEILPDDFPYSLTLVDGKLYFSLFRGIYVDDLGDSTDEPKKLFDGSARDLKFDKLDPRFAVGIFDNGKLGVINLQTRVVKYLDFDGDYSNLLQYSIAGGIVYWSKEQIYVNETLYKPGSTSLYISTTPLYSFNVNAAIFADQTAPDVSIAPDSGAFVSEGKVGFAVDEEVDIQFTMDGTPPSYVNGYHADLFDHVPVLEDGVVIHYTANDFSGNAMPMKSTQPYSVEDSVYRVTVDGTRWGHVAVGSTLVYAQGDTLYAWDIPTKTSMEILQDPNLNDFAFDGRYVVVEADELMMFDLAAGEMRMLGEGSEPDIHNGKITYVRYDENFDDELVIYDIAAGEEIVPDYAITDIDDPLISDDLVLFEDWLEDKWYVADRDSGFQAVKEIVIPGVEVISEVALAGDEVYAIGYNRPDFEERVYRYDPVSETAVAITDPSVSDDYDDLVFDRTTGTRLVATDYVNSQLWVYDIVSGTETRYGSGDSTPWNPKSAGNVIFYESDYELNIDYDILFYRYISSDSIAPIVTADPISGEYNTDVVITFTSNEVASVYLTADGSEPTEASMKYYGPIKLPVDGDFSIKYFAIDTSGNRSEVQTVDYRIDQTAPTVTATPPAGTYRDAQRVFLTSDDPEATIYYSLDETEPSVTWSVYEATYGLDIGNTTLVRFNATDLLGNRSATMEANYVIDPTLPPEHLNAPAINSAIQDGDTVRLEWNSVPYAAGYEVEFSSTGEDGFYELAGTVAQESDTLQFTTNLEGVYVKGGLSYRVRALNGEIRSNWSEPVAVELAADYTHINGNFVLNGVPKSGTTVQIKNADGSVDLTVGYGDSADDSGVVNSENSKGEVIENKLHYYFNVPNGSYSITAMNGTQTRTIAVNTAATGEFFGFPSGLHNLYTLAEFTLSDPVISVTGVELNKTNVALTVGGSEKLIATVKPENASNKKVTWTSGAESIATVDSSGLVKAVSAGEAVITVTTEDGKKTASATVVVSEPASEDSGGGGSGGSGSSGGGSIIASPGRPTSKGDDGSVTLGDGAAKVTKETGEDGKAITKVTLDAAQLSNAFGMLDQQGERKVTLEVSDMEGTASIDIPAASLNEANRTAADAILEIKTPEASYELPVGLLNLTGIAQQAGASQENVSVNVTIHRLEGGAADELRGAAERSGVTMLGDAIEFTITVVADGQTQQVNDFGNAYVTRTIVVSQTLSAGEATAVMYDPATGEMTFVPALFITENGKTRVVMKRNGNSIYAVVSSKKTFADLEGHWAKKDVELLASKLILSGVKASVFAPNAPVTRAEFAAMIARSLGLSMNKAAASYSDVPADSWYAGAVGAAADAGLVSGFEDGRFRANDRITREQMAVMIARAMKFAGKPAEDEQQIDLEATYADGAAISAWAQDAVQQALAAKIVSGRPDGTFEPQMSATRAEAATMLKRLLVYLDFLNER